MKKSANPIIKSKAVMEQFVDFRRDLCFLAMDRQDEVMHMLSEGNYDRADYKQDLAKNYEKALDMAKEIYRSMYELNRFLIDLNDDCVEQVSAESCDSI